MDINTPPEKRRPYFSIIIPMYNRGVTIGRCLDSVFSQDFKDYEVIVVDDGSEDNSVSVVESYLPNPHLVLVKSKENRGVCFARGLGVKRAQGQWLLFIGSDDAFRSGALQTIYEETSKAPQEVGEVKFCYYCEEIDHVIPIPTMPEGILGFAEYLRWVGEVYKLGKKGHCDFLYCQRKEIYNFVSWPTDRQYELLYHVILASKTKTIMSRKVVATVYNNAGNRITKESTVLSSPKSQIIAWDDANSKAKVLKDYGKQLKQYCPNFYEFLYRSVGRLYLQCGKRSKGCRYLLKYMTMRPFSLTGWGMLILGLIGPAAMNCSWLQKIGWMARAIGKKLKVE